MVINKYNPTIIEEGLGAAAITFSLIASPILRPWYRKWGATKHETEIPLPGDKQVLRTVIENTRAITIEAPTEAVWPWLVQMGQGRGGLYSYERLENLVGCDMHNADRIILKHQKLKVGDMIHLSPGPNGPAFVVSEIENGRAIVLSGDDPPTTWSFVLISPNEATTRLIVRFRQDFNPTLSNVLMWRFIVDPINFVMERKMLQGIKKRAERITNLNLN